MGARRTPADDGDRDDGPVRFEFLRDHRERFDIRLLRIGDGIEIDRPDVALRRVGIGLRP